MSELRRRRDYDQGIADLLVLAKAGDTEAANELFQRLWELIVFTVRSSLPERSKYQIERDDIAQDVWVVVSQSLGRFHYEGTASLLCYLRQSVVRMAKKRQRQMEARKRDFRRNEPLEDVLVESDPAAEVLRKEIQERFLVAMRKLPLEQAEMFRLVVLEGATKVDAAKHLKIPESSARRYLMRARVQLAHLLGE